MSDKLRYVILNCSLVLICRTLTCREFVKEDTEHRMVNSFVLGFKDHSAFSTGLLFPYIVQEAGQEFPLEEFKTKLLNEFDLPNRYIAIHPINHVSNEDLKTLYFECGQNISDSWKKLYDYSRTGSSKDKKEFLKTSEKLEESLLILYQGMLGEHGSDSDILQAVKTHNQDYRESFVSDMGIVLTFINLASIVLAHSYNLNDSRSLSDWSKQ